MNTPTTPAMPPPSTPMMNDESPPNSAKNSIALVAHHAQIQKLASMHTKLSNVVASTQTGLNQTYTEADECIAALWNAYFSTQEQLDAMRTDLTTLIEALKDTSPVMAKKRRACIKHTAHAFPYCSQLAALSRAAL